MRAVFSLLGLVVVLAIVGLLVKQQGRSLSAASSADSAQPVVTTPAQAKAVQEQVRKEVSQALEQGAARANASE